MTIDMAVFLVYGGPLRESTVLNRLMNMAFLIILGPVYCGMEPQVWFQTVMLGTWESLVNWTDELKPSSRQCFMMEAWMVLDAFVCRTCVGR